MTDNKDGGNAKAADANPAANAANVDCSNGCDHKKAPESGSKRKTPLLPEPPKDSRNLGSTFHSDAASTTSTASNESRQATKRPHSVTVTPTTSEGSSTITLTVAPFTGGPFSLKMRRTDSVEDLKKAVAKKLKVLKDRICLLYRER